MSLMAVRVLLSALYLETCLAVFSLPIESKPLPAYFYPIEPAIIVPSIYEHDCWGVEDNYCQYWEYDI